MNKIILAKPVFNIQNASNNLKVVLESNYINEGKQTEEFEKKISKILKVKYAVSVTSGTTALFLALKACGVKNDDEVLIPNITFPATANAVKMAGAKPILVDVDLTNLLIDEKSLIKKINRKTKFIIPVHVSGRGGNIKKIMEICKKNQSKLLKMQQKH